MTLVTSRKQDPPLSSYDSPFYQIPSILLTQSSCLRLIHLSDIASCYNQNPVENIEELKQELYRLRGSVWRFFYLDYESLIKSSNILLYNQYEANQWASFYNSFAFELKKVHDFFSVKSGEISRRLEYISNPSSTPMITRFIDLHDAIDELNFDIQDLWHFIKLNFRTFLGIANYLDATLGDGQQQGTPWKSTVIQGQQNQMEKNLLLQRLYRLLVPEEFLDMDLFLHWCLELGNLYHDQFDKHSSSHALTRHANDACCNNTGSPVLSPPSPPPTLYAPIMTRDSSNASTGSLPSSTAPPSPTLTIPSINDQSDPGMRYNSNDESFRTPFASFSSQLDHHHSTPWAGNMPLADQDSNNRNTEIMPPSTTTTNDTVYTFWIHPDNLLEVIMHLAKYMDIIKPLQQASHSLARYEIESPEHKNCLEELPPIQPTSSDRRPFQHWQPITTLYMDTPNLANYTDRIGNTSDTINGDGNDINKDEKTTVPALRLRRYNTTFSRTNDTKHLTTQFCSSAGFYALEKKIYVDKPWQTTTTTSLSAASSISLSSTYTGGTGSSRSSSSSSKKEGKKAYRRRHYHRRPEPSPSWSSIHSRIWLKSKRCKAWMNHQWSLKNVLIKSHSSHHYMSFGRDHANRKYIEQQIMEMESDLQKHELEPVLKTSFNRIGFKRTGDHDNVDGDDHQKKDVTITIDTDITMTRYDANQVTKDPLQQDDYPCATASSNELTRFPFALLRVKLPYDFNGTGAMKSSSLLSSTSSSSPSFTASCSWLSQILSCPMLEPIQNFSLYLHGTSILYRDKVDVLPHWLNKMDVDLQRTENQGCLSGLRRVYHHQRQHSNKSSSQDSASDQATPWSFTNTTLTVSSTKGSSSLNHSERRAITPELMDATATCTETPLLPLHPYEHESNPSINYFTCTTATTNMPSSKDSIDPVSRKPSILLSPAPINTSTFTPQSSSSSSIALSPSSTPIPDENTPLLPSPSGSTKGMPIECNCDINTKPTSSTSTSQNCPHGYNSISPSHQKHISISTSSNICSQQLYKIMDWIQPHLSAFTPFRSSKEKGMNQHHYQGEQQQQPSDDYHISIEIPSDDPIETNASTTRYDWYDTWDHTMVMARRPIPLTLLCGLGSIIVACILYLIIAFL